MSEAVLSEIQFFIVGQAYYFAAGVLICYDYCLTLSREVEFFWRGSRLSPAAMLFYVTRYAVLLKTVFIVLESDLGWPARTEESCKIVVGCAMALNILLLCCAAVFSAMRVYALFGKAKHLFLIILCAGLVNPAITLYLYLSLTIVKHPFPDQCGMTYNLADTAYDSWTMASRASSVVSDGLVLVLTWLRVRPVDVAVLGLSSAQGRTLSTVLVRDNAMYFGSLFVLNLVGLGIGRESLVSATLGACSANAA
ncbi:hypothetical protein B0H21DRAFT_751408 [Amylocystis lapponica]|nr:hypothetical protein B0H21DRAFT_751408 [Amylocystis lapponica]